MTETNNGLRTMRMMVNIVVDGNRTQYVTNDLQLHFAYVTTHNVCNIHWTNIEQKH